MISVFFGHAEVVRYTSTCTPPSASTVTFLTMPSSVIGRRSSGSITLASAARTADSRSREGEDITVESRPTRRDVLNRQVAAVGRAAVPRQAQAPARAADPAAGSARAQVPSGGGHRSGRRCERPGRRSSAVRAARRPSAGASGRSRRYQRMRVRVRRCPEGRLQRRRLILDAEHRALRRLRRRRLHPRRQPGLRVRLRRWRRQRARRGSRQRAEPLAGRRIRGAGWRRRCAPSGISASGSSAGRPSALSGRPGPRPSVVVQVHVQADRRAGTGPVIGGRSTGTTPVA